MHYAGNGQEAGRIQHQIFVQSGAGVQIGTAAMASHGLTAVAREAAPLRQSLDVLSSQANIAGYKAVMLAANTYQRFMPILMTAAGTVKAAQHLKESKGAIHAPWFSRKTDKQDKTNYVGTTTKL